MMGRSFKEMQEKRRNPVIFVKVTNPPLPEKGGLDASLVREPALSGVGASPEWGFEDSTTERA
jgi:hypothetical protein